MLHTYMSVTFKYRHTNQPSSSAYVQLFLLNSLFGPNAWSGHGRELGSKVSADNVKSHGSGSRSAPKLDRFLT